MIAEVRLFFAARRAQLRPGEFALAKQEAKHVLLDKGDASRISAVQTKIIQQYCKMCQPLLPGFLGDVLENSLTEFTGMGREIEADGLTFELLAKDNARHGGIGLVNSAVVYPSMTLPPMKSRCYNHGINANVRSLLKCLPKLP